METDRRPFYVWIIALLPATVIILSWIIISMYESFVYSYGDPVENFLENTFPPAFFIVVCFLLFMAWAPVRISQSLSPSVRRLGYIIPVVLLIPIPLFIYSYQTCTGKFCEIIPALGAIICGISAVLMSFFYFIASKVEKWSSTTFIIIMVVEATLIIGLFAKLFLSNF